MFPNLKLFTYTVNRGSDIGNIIFTGFFVKLHTVLRDWLPLAPSAMSGFTAQVSSYKSSQRGSWKTKPLPSTEIRKQKRYFATGFSLCAGNKNVELGTQGWFQVLERSQLAHTHTHTYFSGAWDLSTANQENSIKSFLTPGWIFLWNPSPTPKPALFKVS